MTYATSNGTTTQVSQADTLAGLLAFIPEKSQTFARSLVAHGRSRAAISPGRADWTRRLIQEAKARQERAKGGEREKVYAADMTAVYKLFDTAKRNLKFPKIVIACEPEIGAFIRINVAGPKSSVPGAINVVVDDGKRDPETGKTGQEWVGRVLEDGNLEKSPRLRDDSIVGEVAALVARFAADPVTGAKESARLTGRCCFCDGALKDERSTRVGYGKTCAAHYDLPW